MIRSFGGKTPRIADSAFVSEAAYIIGDVEIGENSSIWPGAVIRADFASIRIGSGTLIEDNAVLHAGVPMEIGDNVIMGHGVVMHGTKIGNTTLIGNNATVLENTRIGDRCVISAGSLVSPGMVVPDNSFISGVPGRIKGLATAEQLEWIERGTRTYQDLARRYKEEGY
ncbi:MAG: gamma carbonic anhydrase family protein [Chloroflexi bacterium]|nr:gamma carbonic anhydrase family protein [Chloroflexota bacterium]